MCFVLPTNVLLPQQTRRAETVVLENGEKVTLWWGSPESCFPCVNSVHQVLFTLTPQINQRWAEDYAKASNVLLVTYRDFPVGHLVRGFGPHNEPGFVLEMGIWPHMQRQGIATQLLRVHHETLKAEGLSASYLFVAEENPEAKKLYVKSGYKDVWATPIDFYSTGVKTYFMKLEL